MATKKDIVHEIPARGLMHVQHYKNTLIPPPPPGTDGTDAGNLGLSDAINEHLSLVVHSQKSFVSTFTHILR